MVSLAYGLKQRGHDIEFFIYYPEYDFFRSKLDGCGIRIHEYKKSQRFSLGVIKALRRLFRSGNYHVALSYLNTPSVYAEISKLFLKHPKLIVSERSSHLGDDSRSFALMRRQCHHLANHVAVNSVSHKDWLENNHVWLKGKVTTIYNGVDIDAYFAAPNIPNDKQDLRLLAIGRVGYEKNVLTLLQALGVFYKHHGWLPTVSWVGRRDASPAGKQYCKQVDDLLKRMPEVNRHWQWRGECSDVVRLLKEHHALIHPSFYEGLPNVICESLSSGRLVLASNVCDNAYLVPHGERGFLFDAYDPESMADAIYQLASLSVETWHQLSRACRDYAKEALSIDRLVSEYEELFIRLTDAEMNPGSKKDSI